MTLVQNGFSLEEIERADNMDIRTLGILISEIQKRNGITRLQDKLDMAEAFNFAFVGSTYDKSKQNQRGYSKWKSKILREIGKLQGATQETIWGKLKSRRL